MTWRDIIKIMNIEKGFFKSTNKYGIPDIKKDEFEVKELIPYRVDSNRNGTAHFFLDDYRFERCWRKPDSQIEELKKYDGVLSPDFSMYTNYPQAMQIWQVYRNRWCACYWQSLGIKVIPTISWSDEQSFKYCFLGVQKGSTVAIGTVGVLNDECAQTLFMQGFKEMLKQLEPKEILIYGNKLSELEGYKNIRWFDPYMNKFIKAKGEKTMGGRGSGGGKTGGGSATKSTQIQNNKVEDKPKTTQEKRLEALAKARAKRAENLKNGIKTEKKPRVKKAKMSVDNTVSDLKSELRRNVQTDGYISNSDFRVEDYGNTINVSVRYLGKWKNPSNARNEEDYDWQELHKSSQTQINKVVKKLQKASGRKITWGASEKNWIDFDIEKKKGD
ncbi:MAG: DUF4417 domain-containing protein [bacterium]|nr:DUF4417 domain-containing protein [bacterium]